MSVHRLSLAPTRSVTPETQPVRGQEALLAGVARICASTPSPRSAAPELLHLLATTLGAEDARLWWVDGGALRPGPAFRGPVDPDDAPSPVLSSASGAPLSALVRPLARPGWPASLTLPVVAHGEPLALIDVTWPATRLWSPAVLEHAEQALAVYALALLAAREREARLQAEQAEAAARNALEDERARLGESLLHTARLAGLGEVTAGVVHDLSQPLLVVQAYLELLSAESTPAELLDAALPVMTRATDRLLHLVRHLRNYARNDDASREPFEVAESARLARELCVGSMKQSVSVEGGRGVVALGDASQIEQVLVNLITNALQSGGAPVAVVVGRVEQGPTAGWARVEVTDRGPGVPQELRERIFEPFFTTRPRGQGTGLGLAICARIVRDHEGILEVDDAPGGGACFRVLLPPLRAP